MRSTPLAIARKTLLTLALSVLVGCDGPTPRPSEDAGRFDARAAIDAAPPEAVLDAGGGTADAGQDGGPAERARVFPGRTWANRTPEEAGMDPAVVDAFVASIGGSGCLVRDGYMIRSWGDPTARGDWASAAKPVTSTMLFFAVEEGRLASVDAPVVDTGFALTGADRGITFRHLANMTSGYARREPPGAAWAYNDIAINLYVHALFDRVFDDGSADAAALGAARLGALGFEDGGIYGPSRGGYGVTASPRDYARIGWLWLNRGRWDDAQLLPARYFDEYVRPGVPGELPRTTGEDADYLDVGSYGGGSDQGFSGQGIYGFNWWFNAPVGTSSALTWPDAPLDTFVADGHGGREVVAVLPSLGIVVSARGDWGGSRPGDPSAGMNTRLAMLDAAVR